MNSGVIGQGNAILPPWLWFYVGLYLWELSDRLDYWRLLLRDIFATSGPSSDVTGTATYELLRLLTLAELLPSLAVGLGVAFVFVPWLRASYVQRRYRLTPAATDVPVLAEIRQSVDAHGGERIQIRVNLARADQLAFVYPIGARATALAIFAPFVRLWRSDRSAAEAVLLHELAHVRTGEHLVAGTGSFFATVARWWIPIYVTCVLLPTLVVAIAGQVSTLADPVFLTAQLLMLSSRTITLLMIPVAALWLAELEADRIAARAVGNDALTRALGGAPRSWWRQLMFWLAHPPVRFRRVLIGRWGRWWVALPLLLLYPAVSLLRLPLLLAHAAEAYRTLGFSPEEARAALESNLRIFADTAFGPLVAIAIVLLLWPVIAPLWRRLFAAFPEPLAVAHYNVVAAATTLAVSFVAFAIRV